jgi:hypothetical protein
LYQFLQFINNTQPSFNRHLHTRITQTTNITYCNIVHSMVLLNLVKCSSVIWFRSPPHKI